jgi:uncharacterized membrane protein YkgB
MKQLDHRVAVVMHDRAAPLLRVSLAVVFMWFGALKLAGLSPAGPLVADTVPWLNPAWFVPALGAVELTLGAALLLDRARTLVAGVLAAHLAGTFLTFAMQPGTTFQHGNPLLLTLVGEFVLKNLVLLCAALVLAEPIRSRARP